MTVRHAIGCMSGTSCDGIDASLVRIEGTGLDMTAHPIRSASVGLGLLGDELMEFARGTRLAPGEVARLSAALAAAHAKLIRDLVVGEPCDLVAIHGQTVFHDPPLSWQLIEPSIIAEALGAPVVSNLRAADLARGGQGAPITPIADWILLRDQRERRAIVNLGGFCNATILRASARPDDIRGFDVCACNQLLDTLARTMLDQPFDIDGIVAASGSVNRQLHATLVETLSTQANETRSLGSADEPAAVGDGWTESLHARLSNLKPADVLRTACAAIADTLAQTEVSTTDRVLIAGGGVFNATLRAELDRALPVPVAPTDEVGLPSQYREAIEMAVLGALCADGVAITLPSITGCRQPAPVAGVWSGRLAGRPANATQPVQTDSSKDQ